MAKRVNSLLPSDAVTANPKTGKVSLTQIEEGNSLEAKITYIFNKLKEINPDLFRKKSDFILMQDLDPSLSTQLNMILDHFDEILDIIQGIEYEGRYYTVHDVMEIVLTNMQNWSDSQATVVTRI